MVRKFFFRTLIVIVAVGIGWYAWSNRSIHVDMDMSGPVADWIDYGNDRGGTRYSPLTQIDKSNVKHLEVAWTFNTGDVSDGSTKENPSTTAFEGTPLLVDGTLYVPTPFNRIFALDPETGEQRWVYDPKIKLDVDYSNQLICRGVAHWDFGDGEKRLYMGTNDGRLVSVNMKTGEADPDFGDNGEIDLSAGNELWEGEHHVTSPPTIARGVVVVGSAIGDNVRVDAPSGVVRGYDVRTGELKWAWDLRPPDYMPPEDMLSKEGYMLGTPNAWAPMSCDEDLGLVYVPTGNASPDYYGGQRNGADYYASSVVALHAETGEIAWHYQTVHHDLWDFDVPAQPTLVDMQKDGETVPALIQPTKMGMLFCLNRATGEPIFEIEERPVPQSNVPGEQTSPTQPFPVKPEPLIPHEISPEDAWGPLGLGAAECRELYEELHFEGVYTPPQLEKLTMMYPGNAGGSNWGGIAVDPKRQIAIANVMDLPWAVALIKQENLNEWRKQYPGAEFGRQRGTPYAMMRIMITSAYDLPCNRPPWGLLCAVDLKSGDILWRESFGTVEDLAPIPVPVRYGVPNIGGPVITESGLIFIGATMDNYLRAYDIDTGEELWKGRLPAGGQATPMTYRVRPDGKQYVVICAGGHGRAGTTLGDAVVAFALPE